MHGLMLCFSKQLKVIDIFILLNKRIEKDRMLTVLHWLPVNKYFIIGQYRK